MKCPRCGFISYDHLDSCKKCGKLLPKTKEQPHKDNIVELKRIQGSKIIPQMKKIQDIPEKRNQLSLEIAPEDVARLEQATNKSPLPITDPVNYETSQQKPYDIKKHLLPIISDVDDYGLITEAPSGEHLSLEELPILRRILAGSIDVGILLLINLLLLSISIAIVQPGLIIVWQMKFYFLGLFIIIHYLYYTYFTLIYQATPGKIFMRLRVVSLANLKSSKLTFQQISWRWLTMIVGIIFVFAGMLYMIIDDNHAALQDRLSLSLVISKKQFDQLRND
jgi:uncharacterized RDD family membrane protein YckC